MKTKKMFQVVSVLALGLTLASCGKDNKTNTSAVGVNSNGFGNIANQGAANQANSLRSQRPCAYGQPTVQSFTSYVGGGSAQATYTFVGMQESQAYPDIIVVQVSGNQANYQVSMCPNQNSGTFQFVSQPDVSKISLSAQGATGRMDYYYQDPVYGAVQGFSAFTGKGYY